MSKMRTLANMLVDLERRVLRMIGADHTVLRPFSWEHSGHDLLSRSRECSYFLSTFAARVPGQVLF